MLKPITAKPLTQPQYPLLLQAADIVIVFSDESDSTTYLNSLYSRVLPWLLDKKRRQIYEKSPINKLFFMYFRACLFA